MQFDNLGPVRVAALFDAVFAVCLDAPEDWRIRPPRSASAPCAKLLDIPLLCSRRVGYPATVVSAMSTSMSSWPPTRPRRPASRSRVRTSIPYRSAAVSAWRRKLE